MTPQYDTWYGDDDVFANYGGYDGDEEKTLSEPPICRVCLKPNIFVRSDTPYPNHGGCFQTFSAD